MTPAPIASLLKPIEYAVPVRALDKWARADVTCEPGEDAEADRADTGRAVANHSVWQCRYRYAGSTCNDGGKAFVAIFHVTLRPGPSRLIVQNAWVELPLDNNPGAAEMCAYMTQREPFLRELREPASFCGMTPEAAILRPVELDYAGCLCYAPMLNHKWRNALSAIHYALLNGIAAPAP